MLRRLANKDLPIVRAALMKKQNFTCPICKTKLTLQNVCQDHDHATGYLRGVLCRNCNGLEGKLKTIATRGRRDSTLWEYLRAAADYWELHQVPQIPLLYPTHLTDDEKRVKRNAKARKKRAIQKRK